MKTERGLILAGTRDERLGQDLESIGRTDGLTVHCVELGRDLMNHVATPTGQPRIIVLDDDLVDTRGQTLIESIRMFDDEVKIVFIASVEIRPGLELEARREGVYFFLAKPVDIHVLQTLILRALSHETTRIVHRQDELLSHEVKKAG